MKQKLHCWGGTHKSLYPFPQGSHHITTCELSDSDNLEFPLSARVRSPPALRSLNYLACESSLLRVPHPGIVWSARCQYWGKLRLCASVTLFGDALTLPALLSVSKVEETWLVNLMTEAA